MNISPRWLRLVILIGTCLFLILYYLDSLWSASIDVASHYALIARITEFWHLPTTFDPSLGSMNPYPRYAHILAVIFGNLLGSPFAGMQFVALLSLTSLWCSFAFIFSSLPRRILWIVFAVLAAVFLVNQSLIHLEIFGNEIIGNFFFAHFVAQAVAVVLIAIVLFMEKIGRPPIISYLILAFSVPIIQQIHLMPALEVLAMLTLLVIINIWHAKKENRFRTFFLGLSTIIMSLSLTVLNPAFATMGTISDNNGGLELAYTPNVVSLAVECLIIIALSIFLLMQWIRLNEAEARINGLILKYLGLLGIAIAGLCLFQITMLEIGYGSEYAVRKYAFGLNTLLLLDLPLLLVVRFKAKLRTFQDSPQNWVATVFNHAFLGLFVFVAIFTVLPPVSKRVIAVRDIIAVERFALDYRGSNLAKTPGKYDYGIGLFKDMPVFDLVITIGILKAPQSANAFDIVNGHAPSEPELIGRIFTRVDSKPWDIPKCRLDLAHDLVILDGSCSLTKLTTDRTICRGLVDFTDKGDISPYETTGFSAPWNMGRWSVSSVATFTCKLPTEVALLPTSVRISGYGFVNGYNTQRMLVSINGGPSTEILFMTEGEIKSIDIDIAMQKVDTLEFRFVFPDAISPKELGVNDDTRKLGAAITTIEFR